MSVIRFLVLLCAVFVLMPAESGQFERLLRKSKDVATWTLTTCERNPHACEVAADMWERVKDKSLRGMAIVGASMREHLASMPQRHGNWGRNGSTTSAVDTGTLTASDLIPDWRGHLPALPTER